jgi:hypothetical protein
MKYIIAFTVFILALGFGAKTLANSEQSSTAAQATDSEICKPNADTKCSEKSAEHSAHTEKKSSKDWTHKRIEQVAAILPEKQKNPELTVRPLTVKLVSPKFLSAVSGTAAKLEWVDSSDEAHKAKFYHVQVSKDAGFNNRSMYVADEKWVKGTTFDVSGLEAGQKYFWRVAAVNNENDSMFTKSLFVSSEFETK